MVGFISIAFVVVKLKLFKIFQSFSASMKWLWLGSFWPLLLQIWSNFAEVFTRDSILVDKKSFWITFEKFEFLRELDGPKVCTFCPTLIPAPLPVSPWGFRKNRQVSWKTSDTELSKYVKNKGYISSSYSGKTTITFLRYLAYFCRKQGRVTSRRVKIKI